ncbi:hypothetical protein MKFW12EY_41500 [Methylomonas koyamae]|nr:hypothetical protein MKFW12EY_41500 [Methylomonas koyamae]
MQALVDALRRELQQTPQLAGFVVGFGMLGMGAIPILKAAALVVAGVVRLQARKPGAGLVGNR